MTFNSVLNASMIGYLIILTQLYKCILLLVKLFVSVLSKSQKCTH